MKKIYVTTLLTFGLFASGFAQNEKTVCQEIVAKYGKSNPQSEILCVKVKEYERTNNVRVITAEHYTKIAEIIKGLEKQLNRELEPNTRKGIQVKITYAKRHEIPFVAIEKQLLNTINN